MAELKERKWELMEVGETFGPIEVVVTDHMIKSFAYAVDDYDPAYMVGVPGVGRIGHPPLLCREARDVIRTSYDLASGGAGLHAKHECEFLSSPRLGQRVIITGSHIDKYIKRDKQYIILESLVRDEAGNLILRQRSTHLRGLKPGVAKAEQSQGAVAEVPTMVGSPVVEVGDRDLAVGAQLKPIRKVMTQEQMTVFAGTEWKNIHTDPDVARAAGLATTVASGLQSFAYLSELMTRFCGEGWRNGGKLAVAFVSPVFLGDTVYASGQVKEMTQENGGLRVTVDVWCENQAGKRVTVGTASGRILA
ncbi:MAG: MaoC family dehydratase [Sphingomonadaceae bacterium]